MVDRIANDIDNYDQQQELAVDSPLSVICVDADDSITQ
jgi:hypothetical protein